eukprot:scaffold29169_cov76-Phaeocystis_antarctica.AAC.1
MEAGHWCRVRVPGEDVPGATSREKRRVGAGRPPRPNAAFNTLASHTRLCAQSCTSWSSSAAAARSQRCTRLTILLDWHAAHVGGAASGANRGAGSVAACFAMSARSQTPGCNLNRLASP